MTEETAIFFEELKKTRKSKKISLQELSDYTKINISYLESLETGNFDVLPNVYTRLFLRSYCNYIGVNPKEILNQYEIYTLGSKRKAISETESLNEELDNLEESSNNKINLKSKNYKEITITAIVIIILIILFIVINTINGRS